MTTRTVASVKGHTDPAICDVTGPQGRVRSPEEILRQARATSITGVLGQIASVAFYALDILQELKDEARDVQDRMSKLHKRVDNLAQVVDAQISQSGSRRMTELELTTLLPSQDESERVLYSHTISGQKDSSRPAAVVEAYERCEGVPPLELLDTFYDSEQRGSVENELKIHTASPGVQALSISRMKYSNPGFFMEEWMKNENERQQRALESKNERRLQRREAQSLQQTRKLGRHWQAASTDDAKNPGGTDAHEQRLKFLKIRSWKEIYGTGEGKELMKQHHHGGRSRSLRDLRKKAHQSIVAITQSPSRTEEHQQPIVPPPPPPPPSHDDPEHFLTNAVPDTSSIPTSLSGAFMQEMNDDEITTEMEEEFTDGIPPPPPPLPEEFTDHGLSYYYDPAMVHNVKPPPPPPPPDADEQSELDAYHDTYEEEEVDIVAPPPPPPIEEFGLLHLHLQPPPPPSSPPSSYPSHGSRLFEEIQLGADLRSVNERQSQHEAPGPQPALLEQILQKQSRRLRPIESRPRPPLQSRHPSSSPFADSIARILERRSMIASDSDSTNSTNDDDDW